MGPIYMGGTEAGGAESRRSLYHAALRGIWKAILRLLEDVRHLAGGQPRRLQQEHLFITPRRRDRVCHRRLGHPDGGFHR